jgi:threonine dehydratase
MVTTRGALVPPSLEEVRAAAQRLRGYIVRTPLIRLQGFGFPADIYLKLENLQPGGSFKLRPALNALLAAKPESLASGIYTASAGNMAFGLARGAKMLGARLRVFAPETTAPIKIERVRAEGAEVVLVPFDEWWSILTNHGCEGEEGLFIHPAAEQAVLAGDATVGLEIMEDLADVDTIIAPFGAGGLSSGIAAAAKAMNPQVRVLACETTAATPLAASLAAAKPVNVDFRPDAFLLGIGGSGVLPEMWPLASSLLDGAVCVDRSQVAEAVRIGFEATRTVMEGAGAASLAAAIAGQGGSGTVVAVISGGNIDLVNFVAAMHGENPGR